MPMNPDNQSPSCSFHGSKDIDNFEINTPNKYNVNINNKMFPSSNNVDSIEIINIDDDSSESFSAESTPLNESSLNELTFNNTSSEKVINVEENVLEETNVSVNKNSSKQIPEYPPSASSSKLSCSDGILSRFFSSDKEIELYIAAKRKKSQKKEQNSPPKKRRYYKYYPDPSDSYRVSSSSSKPESEWSDSDIWNLPYNNLEHKRSFNLDFLIRNNEYLQTVQNSAVFDNEEFKVDSSQNLPFNVETPHFSSTTLNSKTSKKIHPNVVEKKSSNDNKILNSSSEALYINNTSVKVHLNVIQKNSSNDNGTFNSSSEVLHINTSEKAHLNDIEKHSLYDIETSNPASKIICFDKSGKINSVNSLSLKPACIDESRNLVNNLTTDPSNLPSADSSPSNLVENDSNKYCLNDTSVTLPTESNTSSIDVSQHNLNTSVDIISSNSHEDNLNMLVNLIFDSAASTNLDSKSSEIFPNISSNLETSFKPPLKKYSNNTCDTKIPVTNEYCTADNSEAKSILDKILNKIHLNFSETTSLESNSYDTDIKIDVIDNTTSENINEDNSLTLVKNKIIKIVSDDNSSASSQGKNFGESSSAVCDQVTDGTSKYIHPSEMISTTNLYAARKTFLKPFTAAKKSATTEKQSDETDNDGQPIIKEEKKKHIKKSDS